MKGRLARRARVDWPERIVSLEQRAASGDTSAMTDLGLNLFEGIQDRAGRDLVHPDPKRAVNWFRTAAARGESAAAASLGLAYDLGLGIRRNTKQAILWCRKAVRLGSTLGASNLATVYRDVGKSRLALKWWKRAATMGDGDAAVDVGYCFLYGIGTRKNATTAIRHLKSAIASANISPVGREAAMYHLAIAHLDAGRSRLAAPLLRNANADGDYPEAARLLKQIVSGKPCVPCRCRRSINKNLRGHAACELHPHPGR